MNLQVGSGDHKVAPAQYKRSNWVNVDIIRVPGVNVLASGCRLPFKTESFEEVHCFHVLEHVTRDKYKPMLSEMHRVLKPGGVLYVETPDFQGTVAKLTEAFSAGDVRAIHVWTTSVYGKNERHGMAHHWGFYEELMLGEFRKLGFKTAVRVTDIKELPRASHWLEEPILCVKGVK